MIHNLNKFKAAKCLKTEMLSIIDDLERCKKIMEKHANKSVSLKRLYRDICQNEANFNDIFTKAKEIVNIKGRV